MHLEDQASCGDGMGISGVGSLPVHVELNGPEHVSLLHFEEPGDALLELWVLLEFPDPAHRHLDAMVLLETGSVLLPVPAGVLHIGHHCHQHDLGGIETPTSDLLDEVKSGFIDNDWKISLRWHELPP